MPVLLAVILFYVWLAAARGDGQQGTTTYYFTYLAEGFWQGDLHLSILPDPRLLALDNPYDLAARQELGALGVVTPVDFSLYGGRFYLYWGPAPALLLASFQLFFGRQPVADFFLAFLFGTGLFLTQSLLLFSIWNRYFSTLPRWTFYLCILLAGLVWPAALLRHDGDHARVYEAAIASGQFFLMAGLLAAFTALSRPSVSSMRLALAGVLWTLAIGSRHLLLAPVGWAVLLTAAWILRSELRLSTKLGRLLWLALPLVLGGFALAWYNWARFGSITETGFSYALAGIDLQKQSGKFFSVSYIPQNLYNYILNPPGLRATFPFVSLLRGSEQLIPLSSPGPDFYYAQSITGLVFLFPFGSFALVPFAGFVARIFMRNSHTTEEQGQAHKLLAWIALNLGGCVLLALGSLSVFFWAGMRYSGDFLPALSLLSALGFWQGYAQVRDRRPGKNLYIVGGVILAAISLVLSTLLAISTVYG